MQRSRYPQARWSAAAVASLVVLITMTPAGARSSQPAPATATATAAGGTTQLDVDHVVGAPPTQVQLSPEERANPDEVGTYTVFDVSDVCLWPSELAVQNENVAWFTCPFDNKLVAVPASGIVTVYANIPEVRDVVIQNGTVWFTQQNGIGFIPQLGQTPQHINFGGEPQISDIAAGANGTIWAMSMGLGQLVKYDPTTTRVESWTVSPEILNAGPGEMTVGRDGALWILMSADGPQGDAQVLRFKDGLGSIHRVQGVSQARDILSIASSIWIGGQEGIAEFSPLLKRTTRWFVDTNASAMARGRDGRIWSARTDMLGMAALDPRTGQSHRYNTPGLLHAEGAAPGHHGGVIWFTSAFDRTVGYVDTVAGGTDI